MGTIHTGTTMAPTKLELLAVWLPQQSWYRDTGEPPALARGGGFRLDDPVGDVGIEFMVVTDATTHTGYFVPMTYRADPLDGAGDALIGTSEHGVLGTRWIYDAAYDPVALTQLLDFICGGCEAQSQSASDTPDPSVGRHWSSEGRPTALRPLSVSDGRPDRTTIAAELNGSACSLDLLRVLGAAAPADDVPGFVEADWTRSDGTLARGTVAVVRAAATER
jgi:hypothetical protein